MILEHFLVMLGAETETEKVKSFSAALTKVATIATAVVGALKTVTAAAWAFADSYVRKAEELYKSNSGLISVTKEQVEMSKKYQDGMDKLGKTIESVKVRIAFGFLPTMLEMVDSLNAFLAANKDLIVNGITRLLSAISYVSQVVNNTIRFIAKAVEATIGWKGALLVLAAIFAIVKRAMLMAFITNPITWVVAAILGLMLLIDDFMTYLDGGESQFGEFWGAMIEWIDKVKPSLQAVWDMLVLGMSYLIQFGAFVTRYFGGALIDAVQIIVAALTMLYALFTGNTELMAAAWDGLVENMISMFQNFASLFEPLAQMLVTIMSNVWDSIVSTVSERIELIKSFFSGLKDSVLSVFGSIKDFVLSIITSIASRFNIIVSSVVKVVDAIIDAFRNGLNVVLSAVIAVMSAIITAFRSGLDVVLSVFGSIKDFASTVIMSIAGLFSIIALAVGNVANRIASLFIDALDVVLSAFGSIKDFALSVIASIASGFNIIVSAVIAVASAIITAFFNGLGVVSGAFSSAVEFIASTWSAMTDTLASAFESFIAYFSSIIQTLVSVASSVWDSIVSTIQERINLIVAAISSFISNLGSMLSGVFDIVTAPFAQAFDWISNKFSSLGGLISGAVSGAGKLFGMGAGAAASNTVNNGGSMTVNAPINVTSSDPNKAAKLVKAGVTDTMNTAHRNMGSRVRA